MPATHAGATTRRQRNLIGASWMIASMGAFAIEDALIKAVSVTLPVGQVLVLFGLGGMLVFAVTAGIRGQLLLTRSILAPALYIRFLFEITGRLFYVLALALIPLSTATVILQATPLLVVAGAAVLFGETVGWRRWIAVALGLAGVVIIVKPGTDGFSLLSLLAVVGMIGFAARDLASRAAPREVSTVQLGFYGFIALVFAGALYSLFEQLPYRLPTSTTAALLSAAIVAGVAAYSCLMKAMRCGEVSAVTPFRYSRLLFGVALGVVVFGESPSVAVLSGSVLIVLSGLFILWRD